MIYNPAFEMKYKCKAIDSKYILYYEFANSSDILKCFGQHKADWVFSAHSKFNFDFFYYSFINFDKHD